MPAQASRLLKFRKVFLPLLVSGLAALLSLARLLSTDRESLSQVLWAEDGLFILCYRKAEPILCFVDPYAGYLHSLLRVTALPISELPPSTWSVAANLTAAILAGLFAGLIFIALTSDISRWWVRAFIALIPVLIPLSGLETIQSIASHYVSLIFVSAVLLSFPSTSKRAALTYAILLAVAASTAPTVVLFIPVILLQWRRNRLTHFGATAALGGLVSGLAIQAWMMMRATDGRNLTVSGSSVSEWLIALPNVLTSFLPGLYFGEVTIYGRFTLPVFAPLGLVIAGGAVALAVWLLRGRARRANGIAILVSLGLLFGAIPSVTNEPNNRYLVWTAALWAAAAVLALDARFPYGRVVPLALAASLIVWMPAFPASEWRAVGNPGWAQEFDRISQECIVAKSRRIDPAIEVFFSPEWPGPTNVMPALTSNQVRCSQLFPEW